jgi:rSAM/selenodomain-associated transferase 1
MNPPASLPAVLVMTRWWAEGPVKTRLAADLGQEAARELYRRLAEDLWKNLQSTSLQRLLCVSPADQVENTSEWLAGADVVLAQPEGDLGIRMKLLMHHALQELMAPWVAVVGTDAPAIDAAWVLKAGQQLVDHDVVITPSLDGGYALLAFTQPHAELFSDIPWSTAEVLAVTQQRALEAGLKIFLTEPVVDLDDIHDLHALQADGWLL